MEILIAYTTIQILIIRNLSRYQNTKLGTNVDPGHAANQPKVRLTKSSYLVALTRIDLADHLCYHQQDFSDSFSFLIAVAVVAAFLFLIDVTHVQIVYILADQASSFEREKAP